MSPVLPLTIVLLTAPFEGGPAPEKASVGVTARGVVSPTDASPPARELPHLVSPEYLTISGSRFPLFGPDDSQGGLADHRTYSYQAPIRVVAANFEARSHHLRLVLSFTAPESTLAEGEAHPGEDQGQCHDRPAPDAVVRGDRRGHGVRPEAHVA